MFRLKFFLSVIAVKSPSLISLETCLAMSLMLKPNCLINPAVS